MRDKLICAAGVAIGAIVTFAILRELGASSLDKYHVLSFVKSTSGTVAA